MENKHQEIIEKIEQSLLKSNKKLFIRNPFEYFQIKKLKKLEIDILTMVNSNLCLFEVKSSVQEEDARNQLTFHKNQLLKLKNRLLLKEGIIFSEIKLFWVTEEYNLIVNIETEKQMAFDPTFLENPLGFLVK